MLAADMEPTRGIRRARAIIARARHNLPGSLRHMPGNRLDNAITLRQAFDTLRGPPVTSLRHAFDTLRGPPLSSPFRELRELTERMHAGADLRMPDVHAPPQHAPAPTARRGRPPYNWLLIDRLDAEYCSHVAGTGRMPTWDQRREALTEVLGKRNTPAKGTLMRELARFRRLRRR